MDNSQEKFFTTPNQTHIGLLEAQKSVKQPGKTKFLDFKMIKLNVSEVPGMCTGFGVK